MSSVTPLPVITDSSNISYLFVELSTLTSAKRQKYKPLANRALGSDEEYSILAPETVVGEYRQGSTLWYYARSEDGVVYKVYSRQMSYYSRTEIP